MLGQEEAREGEASERWTVLMSKSWGGEGRCSSRCEVAEDDQEEGFLPRTRGRSGKYEGNVGIHCNRLSNTLLKEKRNIAMTHGAACSLSKG